MYDNSALLKPIATLLCLAEPFNKKPRLCLKQRSVSSVQDETVANKYRCFLSAAANQTDHLIIDLYIWTLE